MSDNRHWWCTVCGTFDGPISLDIEDATCCDVCFDENGGAGEVEYLAPSSPERHTERTADQSATERTQ